MATPSPFPVGPFLWLMIALMSLAMYVVLDGYDLGVGILMLTERDATRCQHMMEIIASAWDGNESWFVLLGIALFAGFPLAYSIILPAFYIPMIVMLLALIFRGMSIEFQSQSESYAQNFGMAFSLGSLVATFCQGVMIGAYISGIPVHNGHFAGTPFGFLNGFSVLTGVFFIFSYCLTGASWLNDKAEEELGKIAKRNGRILIPVVAVLLVVMTIMATLISPAAGNSLTVAQVLTTIGLTLLALISLYITWYSLKNMGNVVPFLFAIFALAAPLLNLLLLNYPYVVPRSITFWQAAAPQSSVNFLLIGVGCCIPIVLAYNTYAYYVFRGKFTPFYAHQIEEGFIATVQSAVGRAVRKESSSDAQRKD